MLEKSQKNTLLGIQWDHNWNCQEVWSSYLHFSKHSRWSIPVGVFQFSAHYHMTVLSFCFNQSQYSEAVKIVNLCCHWWKYIQKDKLNSIRSLQIKDLILKWLPEPCISLRETTVYRMIVLVTRTRLAQWFLSLLSIPH